ncbi:hypothetical protein HK096_003494 [Nowakowskiella sp. JEL0078]|nr:hypothetical protein HK096_003494 [Nowakowskiella sp. JEL0078]
MVSLARSASNSKIHVVEIDHKEGTLVFQKRVVDVFYSPDAAPDFPVAMQISKKYNIWFYPSARSRDGHMYLYMNWISPDTIFVTAKLEAGTGLMGVNKKGQVLSVSVNEQNTISYILKNLATELAYKLASRGDLPGNLSEAAKNAATSPRGLYLTNPANIERFKLVPVAQGQVSPILQYFGILLEKGQLNKIESLELAIPVLLQGRKQLLEKWLKEDKLDCSEELGDIVKQLGLTLALSVYLRANIPNMVISYFAETGQYNKIILYAKKVNYTPDNSYLFQYIMRLDPKRAQNLPVNTSRTLQVVGCLLDVDCDEAIIKGLLMSVNSIIPIDEIVAECEQRNRLKMLLWWLESRMMQGSQDPQVYNAVAKIYIDTNSNAERFLKENQVRVEVCNQKSVVFDLLLF